MHILLRSRPKSSQESKELGADHPQLKYLTLHRIVAFLGLAFCGLGSWANMNPDSWIPLPAEVKAFHNRFGELDNSKATFIPSEIQGTFYSMDSEKHFTQRNELTSSTMILDNTQFTEIKLIAIDKRTWAIVDCLQGKDKCKGKIEFADEDAFLISIDTLRSRDQSILHQSSELNRKSYCDAECPPLKRKSRRRYNACMKTCE